MTDQDELGIKSSDELLFVMRYRGYHVFLRAIVFAFSLIFFGVLTVFSSGSGFGILFLPVGGLLILLSIRSIVELLSFKEIRLYRDRIVQVRRWGIGETEVKLADASLTSSDSRGLKTKSIFNQDMKIYRGWLARSLLFWRIIVYEETLAAPEDVSEFRGLLAHLAGRTIQELEGELDRLIRAGSAKGNCHENLSC
jgi:hypothetical protein